MPKKQKKTREVVPEIPKKKNKRIYFDLDVQDAIVRYNTSDDDVERSNIYGKEIHYAFDKLCENIINTFKFTYFDDVYEDVKCETVAFLVMNMHKYDHTKGSKAFSYFSVVAKNYLILHNNNNYKKYKTHDSVDVLNYKYDDSIDRVQNLKFFMDDMILFFENKIPEIFNKGKNIEIAYALLEILKNRENIEDFNKKAIYILVREMTDVKTSDITKVVNIFKTHYKKLQLEFHKYGYIDMNKRRGKFF